MAFVRWPLFTFYTYYSTCCTICQALFLFFCGWNYGIQLPPSALSCGNRKILGASQFVLFQSPTGRSYLFITRNWFYSAFLRLTTLLAWSSNPRQRGEDLRRLFRLAASLRVFSYPASPSLCLYYSTGFALCQALFLF